MTVLHDEKIKKAEAVVPNDVGAPDESGLMLKEQF
jgi:hypothetical protein